MPVGRPSSYTTEIAQKICDEVTTGKSLATACKEHGMPSDRQVYRWLDENEEFRQMYMRARERRADARYERIDQVLQDLRAKDIDSNMARVEIDTIKWQCGKESPRKYGEKITLAGDSENPLQINVQQSTELLQARIDSVIAKRTANSIPPEPDAV